METSFLLCFAHPARIHNPKMCFYFFRSMVFSSNLQKCCTFKSPLLLPSFASFYKLRLVVLNILPALHPNSLSRKLCLTKVFGECSWEGGISKFLNKTSVMGPFSLHQWRHLAAESKCQKVSFSTINQSSKQWQHLMLTWIILEVDHFLTHHHRMVRLSRWLYTVVIEVKTWLLWVKMILD